MTTEHLQTLEEIERLIDEGTAVESITTLIEHLPVDADEKSALWLRAWCRSEGHRRGPTPPALYLG